LNLCSSQPPTAVFFSRDYPFIMDDGKGWRRSGFNLVFCKNDFVYLIASVE